MTRIATMGTSSCATISIQGFKSQDMVINKKYMDNPGAWKGPTPFDSGGEYSTESVGSVGSFYERILYPTDQDLGYTHDYPFDALMKELSGHKMNDKLICAVVPHSNNGWGSEVADYFFERLHAWGFHLRERTMNSIGGTNYLWIRSEQETDYINDIPDTFKKYMRNEEYVVGSMKG